MDKSRITKKKTASVYSERLERIISQIPQSSNIENSVVEQYHRLVDDLSKDIGKDYSKYRVSSTDHHEGSNEFGPWNYWTAVPVRTMIYDLAGTLKVEYDVGKPELSEVIRNKFVELIGKLSWRVATGLLIAIIVTIILIILGLK